LYALFADQTGIVARWQLGGTPGGPAVLDRLLRTGRLTSVAPGVYLARGHPESWTQRLWVALLAAGPGVVVSHESAAEIHRVEGAPRGLITLTAPHFSHHRVPGAFVHQISDVLPHHVIHIGSLPVTSPPRTIVDLATVLSRARLIHAVEYAHHHRIARLHEVGQVLAELARPGKPGIRKLALVLDHLTSERAIGESVAERLFFDLLDAYGEPRPVSQYPFPGRQAVKGCTDGAYVDAMVIAEIDSRSWHTRIADVRRDRDRDNEAARAGWQTLRFLYEHVVNDGPNVVATVRETRLARLKLLGRPGRGTGQSIR
jgi:hypothetical protein